MNCSELMCMYTVEAERPEVIDPQCPPVSPGVPTGPHWSPLVPSGAILPREALSQAS